MPTRAIYHGPRRKLVLAFDVGTAYSGISYCVLDPGQVPEIKGVTRFPANEHVTGASRIPTVIYYDRSGKVRAVGAEAMKDHICEVADVENWVKAEWFKLHLRSEVGAGRSIDTSDFKLPPLPLNKTVVEVFADFLRYLLECASSYIQDTHANGPDLWNSVKSHIDFVLPHPNGWEGTQQSEMRRAAVLAGLVPDSPSGHSRLSFVTEGEASLHFSVQNGLPGEAMKNGDGVVIVDAGGGTVDISSYSRNKKGNFEEIAAPQCLFHGSVFVTLHARRFLESHLSGSPFLDDLDHIVSCFDKTTKLRFREAEEPEYVKFGSARDNDKSCNICLGQLKLMGTDIAKFFQPSIDCIVKAVLEQQKNAHKTILNVVFVGGFAASDWLFTKVIELLTLHGLNIVRPENHVNKAVSDGAILFYLDHFVGTYGNFCDFLHEPYDLLLNIAFYLDLYDIHALHLTSRSLYDASRTLPVYRKLANDLLRKCRALPLKGFQRLGDLNIDQLIRAVNKATHYEHAWRRRSPRPIIPGSYINGINSYSNYMDVSSRGKLAEKLKHEGSRWYKIVSAPPGEEVDWLSPITSSYTLCATKSGKVVCWDVQSDACLAQWYPGARWELWKCRAELEERMVFFMMAKVLAGSYDDDRIMEFVLMRLTFFDGTSGESSPYPPIFSRITEFRTTGVVMNVFLLDPSERLLSAFIWVSTSNTIGLYAMPDWDKKEYVFIDTGIECVMSSNWSCILFQQHIVIHCEESNAASQHFYPLSLLRQYSTALTSELSTPVISRRLTPFRTLTKKFRFPLLHRSVPSTFTASSSVIGVPPLPPTILLTDINPHPSPPWYPESAYFVRQWWPTLPNIPQVSCTVVLLAAHDQETHGNRFVLAQHYFRVPLDHAKWDNPSWETRTDSSSSGNMKMSFTKTNSGHHKNTINARLNRLEEIQDDALMHLWYVSKPFEVVRVFDAPRMDDEDDVSERPRPLVAVDFGHAVWIEYDEVTFGDDEQQADQDQELKLEQSGAENGVEIGEDTKVGSESEVEIEAELPKRLRFVTFRPFSENYEAELESTLGRNSYEGDVRTLEIPSELDLGTVETINIDQSQGTIILSDKGGRVFILCYD